MPSCPRPPPEAIDPTLGATSDVGGTDGTISLAVLPEGGRRRTGAGPRRAFGKLAQKGTIVPAICPTVFGTPLITAWIIAYGRRLHGRRAVVRTSGLEIS